MLCFTPAEIAPESPLDRRLKIGPRTGLHALKKRKITYLCWESNYDRLVIQPIACPLPTELSNPPPQKERKKTAFLT
jgi:hypothetical protein